jgi:hypothetical protein
MFGVCCTISPFTPTFSVQQDGTVRREHQNCIVFAVIRVLFQLTMYSKLMIAKVLVSTIFYRNFCSTVLPLATLDTVPTVDHY